MVQKMLSAFYLRNHASCDHAFWSTHVKLRYIQAFFLFHFFENFDIWVVVGGGGRREGKWSKKWPKMACCAVRTYLSLSKHYLLSIASILLYFKIEKPILCKKLQLPI